MKIINNKITNILLKILRFPSFIRTFLHEIGHARQFLKANKQLGIEEKIIIIIGCRELLNEPDVSYKMKETNDKIIIFLDNWWSYTNLESIGFTECKNHSLYNEKQVIKMAKAGNKSVFIYFAFLVFTFIIILIINAIFISNLIIVLFSALIFFWLAYPVVMKFKDYKQSLDYEYSFNPRKFINKKSDYVEIIGNLKK